jgi:WD40 repeat protein
VADVFISYSRQDSALVRRLHAALHERGRDTWVDWEGIPPTAEWLKEVFSAIESADNFVFVISPSSVQSTTCARELEHAAKHHKRLVPVLAADTASEQVPEALSTLNWVSCRPEDPFAEGFEKLLSALDTDLDWVRTHTRLLGRALEWDRLGRERSFLLKGVDLETAERALVTNAGSEPRVTTLQSDYVVASRRAVTATHRKTIVVLVAVLLALSVLTTFALIQRQAANNNAARAERNEQVARSNEALAIERNRTLLEERGRTELIEGRWDAAAVLLAETYRLGSDSPTLRLMLARALRPLNGARAMFPGGGSQLTSASLSADGTRAILGELDGSATVWDSRTGGLVAVLSPHDGPVREVHLNTDGSRAVVVFTKTNLDRAELGFYRTYALTAYVWEVADQNFLEEFEVGDWDTLRSVRGPLVDVLASGHRFALPSIGGGFQEFDFGGGQASIPGRGALTVSTTFSASNGEFQQMAMSNDGGTVLLSGPDGSVLVMDRHARSSPLLASAVVENSRIAFHGQSSDLVAVNAAGLVRRIGATDNRVTSGRSLQKGREIVLSPDGRSAVVLGDQSAIPVDLDRGTALNEMNSKVAGATYSTGGQFLLSWTNLQPRIFEFWTARLPGFSGVYSAEPAANSDPSVAAVSNSGAVTFADRWVVQVWWPREPNSKTTTEEELEPPADPTQAEYSPDGQLLATALADGSVLIRGAPPSVARDPLHADTGVVSDLEFSHDSKKLAVASSGSVRIWDVQSGTVLATCRGHGGSVVDIRFSADDQLLGTAASDGTARVWESSSCRELLRFPGHAGIQQVRFDAKGTRLATADRKTVRVWDLEQEMREPAVVTALVTARSPACLVNSTAGRWTRPDQGQTRGTCSSK